MKCTSLLILSLLFLSCTNTVRKSAKELVDSAETLMDSNKFKKAEIVLRKAIEIDDESSVAYNDMAVCKHKQNDPFDTVVYYFEKAKNVPNATLTPYVNLANLYIEHEMYESALREATYVINNFNNFTDTTDDSSKEQLSAAYDMAGKASDKLGFPGAAISYLKKSIALDQYNLKAYVHLSYAYAETQNYDKGILIASTALEIKPTCSQALNNRGICYTNSGDYSLALKDLNNAIAIDSFAKEYYYNRAFLFEKMGDKKRALNDYRKAYTLGDTTVIETIKKLQN